MMIADTLHGPEKVPVERIPSYILARMAANDPEAKAELDRRFPEKTPAETVSAVLDSVKSLLPKGFEAKDKVRTPEGAEQFGQPIGSTIRRDLPTPTAPRGRVGVHTGLRTETANPEKNNKNLVHEATSYDALPESEQEKLDTALDNLGITRPKIEDNITAVYDHAVTRANPDGGTENPPAGIEWYYEAHAAAVHLQDGHDINIEQASGMIAAASPQQAWGDNVISVEYVMRALDEDHEVQMAPLEGMQTRKVVINKKTATLTMSGYEWAKRETEGGGAKPAKKDGKVRTMPPLEELRGKRMSELDPYIAASLIKSNGQSGYRVQEIGGDYTDSRTGEVKPINKDGHPLRSLDDMTGEVMNIGWTCGTQHLGRAIRIARGEQPDEILNGHKVRSFYNNILDPENEMDDVTVDSHAFSVAMADKFGSGSDEYGYFAGSKKWNDMTSPGSATLGYTGLYSIFADEYRTVAQRLGISARQLQAITWIQWRLDHPDDVRGKVLRDKIRAALVPEDEEQPS
jgi:hypothetical protein